MLSKKIVQKVIDFDSKTAIFIVLPSRIKFILDKSVQT